MSPPRILTIAGSDSGGGAGIQADLKTFAAHGTYGMSVITAVTAQNTREVRAVHAVPPSVVAAQIDAVFDDIGVDAVKVGMLANRAVAAVVAERLAVHRPPILVIDPVMVAASGASLLDDDAVAELERLFPAATVVTPNLPEAERLADVSSSDPTARGCERLAVTLHGRWMRAGQGPAMLVKGGHAGEAGQPMVDVLATADGIQRFEHERLVTRAGHGTGCTLSSAIACRLAQGESVSVAVADAIDYLHGAIRQAFPLGGGQGPANHLYLWEKNDSSC